MTKLISNTKDKARDLGSGSIVKHYIGLAVPAVVAQVVNLLYNIVDRMYIGHMADVGALALTGVGLFTPILMLLNAFAMLSGSGGAPRAAIYMGKADNKTAEKIMGNCLSLLICMSVVLTVVFYVLAPTLLTLFGASDATLPYALAYSRIYILGTVFVLLVMGMNPFITTQGFSKIAMLTTVIGAVINIILDPIFIFGLDMGVRGAATATVISQAIAALWILRFLCGKNTILRLKRENLKFEKNVILPCLGLGVSSFVMLSTESILSISFTSSLSKYGGDIAVGAMTILTSVNMMVTLPLQGMCQGGQPLISYNFGARKNDRVRRAFRTQLMICACYAIIFWLLVMIAPQIFAMVFTSNSNLITYVIWAMRIYMAGIFALGFQMGCQQSFMALGEAKISLLLACLRKLILLIPLIYILPLVLENKAMAVFLAEPVSDIIAATVTTITFFRKFNRILERGANKRAA